MQTSTGRLPMTVITLVSEHDKELQPLVKSAIDNELRLLEAGLLQTAQRLKQFEKKFNVKTSDFIRRYENDEIEETLDAAEWIGEFRMHERFIEKIEALKGIRFAH